MRFFIWIVLFITLPVSSAWLLSHNQGHVTLFWNKSRIDLSLNLFLCITFLSFVITYALLEILSGLINLPVRAKAYRARQRQLKGYEQLLHSVDHLFAGRYSKALKSAEVAALHEDTADVAQMIVAQSNHQLKQFTERDEALEKISHKQYLQAKQILRGQMYLEERKPEEALTVVANLQKGGARQFMVQNIAMRAHQMLQDWPEVVRIANNLTKRNFLPPLVGQSRIQEALSHWVAQKNIDAPLLLKQWRDFSELDQKNPTWVRLFAIGLLRSGSFTEAKRLLDAYLDQELNASLLSIYPRCADLNNGSPISHLALIQKVEGWLLKDPAQPSLHLALAELCEASQLWGKAIQSCEKVMGLPRVDHQQQLKVHLVLARVYDALGDAEKKIAHQEDALRILQTQKSVQEYLL